MRPALSVLVSLVLVGFMIGVTRISIGLQLKENLSGSFFESGPQGVYAWGRTTWLAVVMIIGIVLGHLHSRLVRLQPDARVDILKELHRAVSTGAFWRSFITSPVIFGLTYLMSRNQPDTVVATVLALENGFFCDVLFKRRERETVATSASSSPQAASRRRPSKSAIQTQDQSDKER